jgi:hypothetical protein
MAAQRNRTGDDADKARDDWPRHLAFAGLVAAVLAVLLLGVALRTDRPHDTAIERDLRAEPGPREAVGGDAPAAAVSRQLADDAERPPASVNRLAARAAADLERLAASGDGWTAQLAVLCDRTRVNQLLERFGQNGPFHVLPVLQGDSACFRICWNRYARRDAAQRAADLPAALRAIEAHPLPKAISEVVE